MASFEQNKKTLLWSVRFRIKENGKTIRKRLSNFNTKKQAFNAYMEYIKFDCNTKFNSTLTLNEVFNKYIQLKEQELQESTLIAQNDRYNKFIKPKFGNKYVKDITKQDIMMFQSDLTLRNYSYGYKSAIRTLLNSILNYAVDYLNLEENVLSRCKGFAKPNIKKEMHIWTINEYKQFINIIDNPIYKILFELMYVTGIRKGEALALKKTDVLSSGEINITKTYSQKTKKAPYVIHDVPKTFSSIRKVMLPNKTYTALTEYINKYKIKNNDFLFYKNRPIAETTLKRNFDKYIQIANVPKITIHELRHSHASMLINANEPISLVSKRLGHSNIEQTLNTYTHVLPSEQKELANRINNLL